MSTKSAFSGKPFQVIWCEEYIKHGLFIRTPLKMWLGIQHFRWNLEHVNPVNTLPGLEQRYRHCLSKAGSRIYPWRDLIDVVHRVPQSNSPKTHGHRAWAGISKIVSDAQKKHQISRDQRRLFAAAVGHHAFMNNQGVLTIACYFSHTVNLYQ